MQWIAPSEKDITTVSREKRLWHGAEQCRANSGLKSQEYSPLILALIFLRLAGQRAKLESPPHRRAVDHGWMKLTRTDNANYLWIQLSQSALNPKGRAGFVMANRASDTHASEQEIRCKLNWRQDHAPPRPNLDK